MKNILSLLACLCLFSCAGLPTPSGNAEVTIPKSQRADFTARFTGDVLTQRGRIADQGPQHVVYEFVGPEGLSIALVGEAIRSKLRLDFVEIGGTVRVVGTRSTMKVNAFGGTQENNMMMMTHERQALQEWMSKAAGGARG